VRPRRELSASGVAERSSSSPATRTTAPSTVNCAGLRVAEMTPAGDQENLYASGVEEAHSGAGRPPHREEKAVTAPPSSRTRRMSSAADMWSRPASS